MKQSVDFGRILLRVLDRNDQLAAHLPRINYCESIKAHHLDLKIKKEHVDMEAEAHSKHKLAEREGEGKEAEER